LKQKPGRVEEADGGTIFLDEIADMSRPLQAKLLRFLEDGTFTRVGGTQELGSTSVPRRHQSRHYPGHCPGPIPRGPLPPSQRRPGPPPAPTRTRRRRLLLAEYFLKTFSVSMNRHARSLSRAARQKLTAHHWPGNVRELRNVIERALILETSAEVQPSSLPDFQLEARLHKTAAPKPAGGESLDEIMTLRARSHHRHLEQTTSTSPAPPSSSN